MNALERYEFGDEFQPLSRYVNGEIDADELINVLKLKNTPSWDSHGVMSARSEIEQIKASRRKVYASAVASLRLEGLVVDSRFHLLIEQYIDCKISIIQAIAAAKSLLACSG